MKTKCSVRHNNTVKIFRISTNFSLLSELRAHKVPIPFSCGGEGICTTCRVILINGSLSPQTEFEKKRTQERGYSSNERLSCQCRPTSDHLEIKIP